MILIRFYYLIKTKTIYNVKIFYIHYIFPYNYQFIYILIYLIKNLYKFFQTICTILHKSIITLRTKYVKKKEKLYT